MECGPETGGLGLQGAVSGSGFYRVRISMSCGLHGVMHLRVGCMGSMRLRTYLDHLGSVELMNESRNSFRVSLDRLCWRASIMNWRVGQDRPGKG